MFENGASNKVFYYGQAGTGATFDINYRLDFKNQLDKKALSDAVSEALKLFPEFAVRPVIKDNRIFYEENHDPAPVIDEGKTVCFGSDDTNGYLFCLQCSGNSAKVSYYHGMSDTVGFFRFMRSFLYFYAVKIGMEMPDDAEASTRLGIRIREKDKPDLGRQDTIDPYRCFMNEAGDPEYEYANPGAFVIPEPAYDGDDNKYRVFDLEMSVKEFLGKTKEYGVSFIPLLASVTSKAIAECYDTKGKPVIAMVPVNLRTGFETSTVVNMSDGIMMPMDDEMSSLSVTDRSVKLKEFMKKQMTKENYCKIMRNKVKALEGLEAKGDIIKTSFEGTRLAPPDAWRPLTYALTYPGKLDLPAEYDGLLDYIYNGPLARAFCLIVATYADSMQVKIVQRFDSQVVANRIKDGFAGLGLNVSMTDRGIVTNNLMLLERLKKCAE